MFRTPPPTSPVSPLGVAVSLSGVPVTGAQRGGVWEWGSNDPPPPARASQFSVSPVITWLRGSTLHMNSTYQSNTKKNKNQMIMFETIASSSAQRSQQAAPLRTKQVRLGICVRGVCGNWSGARRKPFTGTFLPGKRPVTKHSGLQGACKAAPCKPCRTTLRRTSYQPPPALG